MPDIDVFFGWAPWAPLAMHRGFTHGLVGGVLVMPPLLAGLLWLLDRWQQRQGRIAPDAPPLRFGWLVALCYAGAITHPLLDLQNVYAVQLFSPLSDRWLHTDGLFIVSPWLLAMLGAGIWLARRGQRCSPAIAALLAGLLFIAGNVGISALARRSVLEVTPAADRIFASPAPVWFWRRDMVWREQGMISFAHYNPVRDFSRLATSERTVPDNMALPIVRSASIATPEVIDFLVWSQMPVAHVDHAGCTVTVTFGDARFTGPAMARNFNSVVRLNRC